VYMSVCTSFGRYLMSSLEMASSPSVLPSGARCMALVHWLRVMYVSSVTFGCIGVRCVCSWISKLSGLAGCVY
jgi:hypothetical protein